MVTLDILKQFGLHTNDIKVYTALFSLGRSKTGLIIATSKVSSSRVYESLRLLINKGLVSYEVKNNIKYYKAELPDQLIQDTEKNMLELKLLAKKMTSLPIIKQDRNETNTCEGTHGFKKAFLQHMANIGKNEPVEIIAFSNHTTTKSHFTKIRNLFREVDDIVFAKTKNVRMLIDSKLRVSLQRDRKLFSKYTLRFLPSGYFGQQL